MAHGAQDPNIDSSYARRFQGILAFATLAAAEETIRKLEKLRQEYLAAGDEKGVMFCRQTALLGRRRAELIARSARVRVEKRQVKLEIAHWFQIWLETPELFEGWLKMRKNTSEFQRLQQLETSKG